MTYPIIIFWVQSYKTLLLVRASSATGSDGHIDILETLYFAPLLAFLIILRLFGLCNYWWKFLYFLKTLKELYFHYFLCTTFYVYQTSVALIVVNNSDQWLHKQAEGPSID